MTGSMQRSCGKDGGFTLVEAMLVSLLTLIVFYLAYGVLSGTTATARSIGYRAVNSSAARLAIDDLDADVRYANGIWQCGSTVGGTCSPTSLSVETTVVQDAATPSVTTATCTTWAFLPPVGSAPAPSSYGLERSVDGGGFSLIITGVVAAAPPTGLLSSGFSLPMAGPHLVEFDFTVNQDPLGHRSTGDTVSVHDLVSPDNVRSGQDDTTLPSAC